MFNLTLFLFYFTSIFLSCYSPSLKFVCNLTKVQHSEKIYFLVKIFVFFFLTCGSWRAILLFCFHLLFYNIFLFLFFSLNTLVETNLLFYNTFLSF